MTLKINHTICGKCGALVGDEEIHRQWHEEMRRVKSNASWNEKIR